MTVLGRGQWIGLGLLVLGLLLFGFDRSPDVDPVARQEFQQKVERTAALLARQLQHHVHRPPAELPAELGQFLEQIRELEAWSSLLYRSSDGRVFLQTGEADPRAPQVHQAEVRSPRHGGRLRVTRRGPEPAGRKIRWPIAAAFFCLGGAWVLFLPARSSRTRNMADEPGTDLRVVAAGLAHELRNPLNTVRFNLSMLEEDLQAAPVDAETRQMAREIREELERLDRLLGAWVVWATGGERRSRSEVDLVRFVREVVDFLTDEYAAAGVAFLPTYPDGELSARIDAEALRQVLLNLFRNAREAMPGGGAIHLRLEAGPDGPALEIEDEGPGVAPELRERIFQPFVSGRSGGSGLGLAVADRLLRGMGGRIELLEGDRGARFRIVL